MASSPKEATRLIFRKLIYRRVVLRRYELVAGRGVAPRHPLKYRIEALDPRKPGFEDAIRDANPHLESKDIDHLLDNPGAVCVAAFSDDGEIIASTWMTNGRVWINELQRYVDIEPREQMRYRSFVHPDHRGQSLHAHLILTCTELVPEGDIVWGYVYAWNLASIISGESIGQRFTGESWTAHVLGVRIARDRRFSSRPPQHRS